MLNHKNVDTVGLIPSGRSLPVENLKATSKFSRTGCSWFSLLPRPDGLAADGVMPVC